MPILKRTFEYIDETKDSTVKASGWRLLKTPSFDPMNIPYSVVHDALEHHVAGEDGIEAEMMAFGALYHLRVQGKWWEQFGLNVNALKMVAWDIARFLNEREFIIAECPVKASKSLKRNMFDPMLTYYLDHLVNAYQIQFDSLQYDKAVDAYQRACGWMSKGYKKAIKRWCDNPPTALTQLFNSLTSLVTALPQANYKERFMLMVNTKTLEHSVKMC